MKQETRHGQLKVTRQFLSLLAMLLLAGLASAVAADLWQIAKEIAAYLLIADP